MDPCKYLQVCRTLTHENHQLSHPMSKAGRSTWPLIQQPGLGRLKTEQTPAFKGLAFQHDKTIG